MKKEFSLWANVIMRSFLAVLAFSRVCRSFPSAGSLQPLPSQSGSERILQESGMVRCRLQAARKPWEDLSIDESADVKSRHQPADQVGLGPVQARQGRAITNHKGWLYFTNITLGTPPQTFRAAIDIGFSDLFVTSTRCTEHIDCIPHLKYDSSNSSTYEANGTDVHVYYGGFYTSGFASTDTLRIGDLRVANQSFEEATDMKPTYFFDWDNQYDGVLGLPRHEFYPVIPDNSYPETTLRATSPFHNIIQQQLLKRNIFSLRLPQGDSNDGLNDAGEMLLGAINPELFVGPLHTFQITASYSKNEPGYYILSPGWQIAAHSVTYQKDDDVVANFDLAGHVAAFSTGSFFIGLPRLAGENLLKLLDADILNQVNCSQRHIAPDITISLGEEGVPFVLKPEDYIRRNPRLDFFDPKECQVEIVAFDEPEDGVNFIMLGSVFLARFYSVFDWDNKTISLAELK